MAKKRSVIKLKSAIKLATVLLPVLTILVSVWQFLHKESFNDAQEFKRAVWNKRLQAYETLGQIAGGLVVNYQDTARFDSLSNQFYIAYWGTLPLVDDAEVEAALKAFSDEVKDVGTGQQNEVALKRKGYTLMLACKNELKKTWDENLGY